MCGRYTLTKADTTALAQRFLAQVLPGLGEVRPRFNIAPTQPVVVVGDDGQRSLTTMRWGLIPSWAKDPAIGGRLINARAETLAEKPAFRIALRKRRCLIPADGFFEWPTVNGRKQPVRIVLKDKEVFAFAGLWDRWVSPEGEEVRSCTIITCEPNELMATLHHRMPVILTPGAEAAWLDPSVEDPALLSHLLKPYPAELMAYYPVSRHVNAPANDTPECVAQLPLWPTAGG